MMASHERIGDGPNCSNYKDIYDLLDKLCKSFSSSPEKQRDLLKNVTGFLSNCPTALGSTLPFDETSLMSKIAQTFRSTDAFTTKDDDSGNVGSGVKDTASPDNCLSLFFNLYDELKSSKLETHQRTALLTFLYFLSNSSKSKFENGYKFLSKSNQRKSSIYTLNSLNEETMKKHTLTNADDLALDRNLNMNFYSSPHDINLRIRSLYKHNTQTNYSDESKYNVRFGLQKGQLPLGGDCDDQSKVNDDIIQNIIYSFTGIQGKYLKKDVITGVFKLDTNEKPLDIVQAGMLLRLSELGYYHDLLKTYTDPQSGLTAIGLMGQGFIGAIKNELTQYYGMIAILQEQFNKHRFDEISQYQLSPSKSSLRAERLTLMKIFSWSVEPLCRLKWLANIAEACKGQKGGALASSVYKFLINGDPLVKSLANELLLSICSPLYKMLTKWLFEGEICDLHGEFFIECLSEIGPDRLWHDKYRLRTPMLPIFISSEMAHKILVTGKSINFLREVCEDKQPVKGLDEMCTCINEYAENIFSRVADTKFHTTIESIYLNTSKRVLDIVMGPHKLFDHLQAMRRYLLLGQGDFIGILMENLKTELDKPAKELYSYDLSSLMDVAVRSTNAQYDDPEILKHLDVRLIAPCDGDVGWDILSLQYTVRGPLATMLEPSMGVYRTLFKPLWHMKHMEFVLTSKIWKEQKCNAKPLRCMSKELNAVLYKYYLLTSEMIHFIHQMQYYILFEVIECSWALFQERVQQAKALDDILNAHNDFLSYIKCGVFLDTNSAKLSNHLDSVYDGIVRLELWQSRFYELCFKELNERKEFEKEIIESEKRGEFGVTAEKQSERDQKLKAFDQILNTYNKNLENISSDYERAVRCFLLALNTNNDLNLQLFSIRLDFNEYYKKRDQRLCVPLTFEHMRLSNVYFNTTKSMTSMHCSLPN